MNTYQQRIEAKRSRYAELAESKKRESDQLAERSSQMASIIPMGQPILVGHHSERRDRNYRKRIGDTMNKAIEADKIADYYANKAESYGTHGISSDDQDAITKLKEKLDFLEKNQKFMKEQNAIFKKKGIESCEPEAREAYSVIMRCQPYYNIPYPPYALSNNNANIKRIRDRIATLETNKSVSETVEDVFFGDIKLSWNTEENRICFFFSGKPSEAIRTILKSNGYKWSPTRGAWVRMANQGVWARAKQLGVHFN